MVYFNNHYVHIQYDTRVINMNMMRSLFQVEPSYTCESSTDRVAFGKALDPLTVPTLFLMDLGKTFEFPTSEEREDQIVTNIECSVILAEKTQHYVQCNVRYMWKTHFIIFSKNLFTLL